MASAVCVCTSLFLSLSVTRRSYGSRLEVIVVVVVGFSRLAPHSLHLSPRKRDIVSLWHRCLSLPLFPRSRRFDYLLGWYARCVGSSSGRAIAETWTRAKSSPACLCATASPRLVRIYARASERAHLRNISIRE